MRVDDSRLEARLVVWGPSAAGKSSLLASVRERIGSAPRAPSPDGDRLVLSLGEVRGLRTAFQLVEAPGHATADAKLERLRDVDLVIFVADARHAAVEANRASLAELRALLARAGAVPSPSIVLVGNKMDLAEALPADALGRALDPAGAPALGTVATTGVGVMDAVKEAARRVLLAAQSWNETAATTEQLDAALVGGLERIAGRPLAPSDVLTRLRPGVLDGAMVAWPSNVLGVMRLVRREDGGVLFVTQGLSFPFAPSLHPEPREPFGYELAIELAGAEPMGDRTVATSSDADLANCWAVYALWFLADVALHEDIQYARRLERFGALTTRGHEQADLAAFAVDDEVGGVGYLLGATVPDAHGVPVAELARGVRLVVATLAYPTELVHAVQAQDGRNVAALLAALGSRAHVSSRVRTPVSPRLA